MARIKLDLAEFQHVKSDKDTTTLKHKKGGHMLTIMHSALAPENQEQLKALSNASKADSTPLQADESMHQQQMAEGGEVGKDDMPLTKEQHVNEMHKSVKAMSELVAKHGKAAEGMTEYKRHAMMSTHHAGKAEVMEAKGGKINAGMGSEPKKKEVKQNQQSQAILAAQSQAPQIPTTPPAQAPTAAADAIFQNALVPPTPPMPAPKEPQPHKAPKSEIKYQDKKSDKFGSIEHRLAEGGEVDSDKADYTNKPDNGYGAIIFKADGGEVEDHEHEGGAYCMHCGGKMMAYGGYPGAVPAALAPDDSTAPAALAPDADVSAVPNTDITQMPNPSPQQAQLQGLRDTYDNLLRQSGSPTLKTFAESGPDGPPEVNPNIMGYAQNMHQVMFDADSRARAQEEESLNQENQMRAKFGLQPKGIIPQPMDNQAGELQLTQPAEPGNEEMQPTAGTAPQGATGSNGMGFDVNNPMGSMAGALNQAMSANTAIGKAQSQQAQQQQAIEQNAVDTKETAINAFNNSYQDLDQERKGFIQDIQNGYIDPEKYWDNHSKLMSGIGMILAGFNPTSNPNAAIGMLKFQMDQNLQAQQRNLGAKENLLSANMRQFGNLRDAMDMTRVMQNEYVQHQTNLAASTAGSPIAMANAKRANAQLALENAPLMMRLSTSMALQRLSKDPNATPDAIGNLISQEMTFNPEMGKIHNAAYVPGVGLSSSLSPIPDNDKNRIQAYNNTLRLMNDALNFKTTHPGASFSAGDRAQAESLMNNLGNQIRTAEDMGVFKPSESALMKTMLGNSPAGFFSSVRTTPKLQEMMREKQNEYAQLLKSHNLPIRLQGQTLGQPQGAAAQPQQSAPNTDGSSARGQKSGRPMVMRNGQWYYAK